MFRSSLSLLTAAILLAATATPALAWDGADSKNAVGLYISNLAGSGLTYMRELDGGWGFHVSLVGWGQGSSMFFNGGAALTREIDRRPWGVLYGLLGAGAGLNTFSGEAGLQGGSNLQVNLAPGIGFAWGPLFGEVGYSVYHNGGGFGFGPGAGLGLKWSF